MPDSHLREYSKRQRLNNDWIIAQIEKQKALSTGNTIVTGLQIFALKVSKIMTEVSILLSDCSDTDGIQYSRLNIASSFLRTALLDPCLAGPVQTDSPRHTHE